MRVEKICPTGRNTAVAMTVCCGMLASVRCSELVTYTRALSNAPQPENLQQRHDCRRNPDSRKVGV